jgi:hypothetical protein
MLSPRNNDADNIRVEVLNTLEREVKTYICITSKDCENEERQYFPKEFQVISNKFQFIS